jgi:hypothetical protein
MTIDDIQQAVRTAAGPVPITLLTYTSIADQALRTLDITGLNQSDVQVLSMEAQHMNTPGSWLDRACERVASRIKKAVSK